MATAPRFYLPLDISVGESLSLTDGTAHHLLHVLRGSVGDTITLFNGAGGEYTCTITSVTKKSVTAMPIAFVNEDRSSSLGIRLGMCVLKRDAMDRVISRATELGIGSISPVLSERCSVSRKIIQKRQTHWQQVAIAASEQCGLNRPPVIDQPLFLDEWISGSRAALKLVAAFAARSLPKANAPATIDLLVGPEGGLTNAEQDSVISTGFQAVTFGERILRAETAPIVAISLLQREWGDFS